MADLMDDDNMYPNDGEWFAAPGTQTEEAKEELDKLRQAKPLVRDVIQRFNDQIDYYTSIDSIEVSLDDAPAVYQRHVEANRIVRDKLIAERDYIMSLLDEDEQR
jgi:hypothetical protein